MTKTKKPKRRSAKSTAPEFVDWRWWSYVEGGLQTDRPWTSDAPRVDRTLPRGTVAATLVFRDGKFSLGMSCSCAKCAQEALAILTAIHETGVRGPDGEALLEQLRAEERPPGTGLMLWALTRGEEDTHTHPALQALFDKLGRSISFH